MLICANVNQLPTNHLLITQHLCWLNRLIHRLTAYFLAPSITWAEVTRAARVGGGDLGVSIGIPINQHNQFKPFSSHSISISFNPISVYSPPPFFNFLLFVYYPAETFNIQLWTLFSFALINSLIATCWIVKIQDKLPGRTSDRKWVVSLCISLYEYHSAVPYHSLKLFTRLNLTRINVNLSRQPEWIGELVTRLSIEWVSVPGSAYSTRCLNYR